MTSQSNAVSEPACNSETSSLSSRPQERALAQSDTVCLSGQPRVRPDGSAGWRELPNLCPLIILDTVAGGLVPCAWQERRKLPAQVPRGYMRPTVALWHQVEMRAMGLGYEGTRGTAGLQEQEEDSGVLVNYDREATSPGGAQVVEGKQDSGRDKESAGMIGVSRSGHSLSSARGSGQLCTKLCLQVSGTAGCASRPGILSADWITSNCS